MDHQPTSNDCAPLPWRQDAPFSGDLGALLGSLADPHNTATPYGIALDHMGALPATPVAMPLQAHAIALQEFIPHATPPPGAAQTADPLSFIGVQLDAASAPSVMTTPLPTAAASVAPAAALPAGASLPTSVLFPAGHEASSGSASGSSGAGDADARAWGIAVAMSNAQRYAEQMWQKEVAERRPAFGTTRDRDLKRKETNRKSAKVSRVRRREYLSQLEKIVVFGEENTQLLKAEVDAIDREQHRLVEQLALLRAQLGAVRPPPFAV